MSTGSKACTLRQATSLLVATLVLASRAYALSPDLQIAQFYHTAWTAKDGAPTGVESLAQTSDGYLWIAGSAGLFRFDGVRFERVDVFRGRRLPSSNLFTLFAPRAGGLWIGYRFGGASFVRDGEVTNFGDGEGLASGTVIDFAQDSSGVVWATTARGLKRFNGSVWEDVRETMGLPSDFVKAMRVARDGTLWIVIGHAVMLRRPGQSVFEAADIETSEGDVAFVEAPDGTLWLADLSRGVRAVYVPNGALQAHRDWIALRDARHQGLLGKLIDRDGALWSLSVAGIHRTKNVARLLDREFAADSSHDVFSDVDGLTASYAAAFLEDREGNVWIGTAGGVDRFRESRLTQVQIPRAANGFAIAAGDAGALLVGIDSSDGVFKISVPSTAELAPGPQYITCAYRDDDGVVWLGGRGMLWRSDGSPTRAQWVPISVPVDRVHADYHPVQAIAKDRAGRLWVSVVRGGTFRRAAGEWTRFGDPALTLASDKNGRVWIGYPKSRIQIVDADNDGVRELSVGDGLDIGNITAIYPRTADAWVGGELGLARFDGRRFHPVMGRGGRPLPSVSGVASTREGDLWISTSEGAMKIAADEVKQLSTDALHGVRYELFDFLDGMPGTPNAIRPLPSIAAGTDGRLWFATSNGVVWVDPMRLKRNTVAPTLDVQAIVADGKHYEPAPSVRLPIGTRNLQINYTALSLSIPERVRFRYQLGSGPAWQDVGSRRAAYFTDLDPGDYTFRVAAANESGIWNESGAALEIVIPPTFVQTRTFIALCAAAAGLLLWLAYALRVRQLTVSMRNRLEERVAERERIARELHDTLLQSVQGLILKFQAATEEIPCDTPARQMMERALDRADDVLIEGRDRVKELRISPASGPDLPPAIGAMGAELASEQPIRFNVSVEGTPRPLDPIVREEVLRIAHEALTNAFRHARAAKIEADIVYRRTELQLRFRDDGCGIDSATLKMGRPDHWGLAGMRERARKIRASFEVWSRVAAGTEIELRVPARVAYARDGRRWNWRPGRVLRAEHERNA